jgi:GT2 family glycosyltransferase
MPPPMQSAASDLGQLGVVVIGRNEGERLRRCLESVLAQTGCVVYVDSGSTDGSVAMAEGLGVTVHALDMRQPFTAARARNQGVARLLERAPTTDYIQFVDGDCEVVPGWLEHARDALSRAPAVAAVCGRLRERHPERSIYNRLCDIEWDTPVGEAKACGGIAMMRASAFVQVRGFSESLIAGEEPELCVRLRAQGWTIRRLDAEMAWHDAAMTRFGQWWQRSKRAGFAYAEGVRLHGAPPERHWVREARSAWAWGAGIPVALAVLTTISFAAALLGLLVYPLQIARLALRAPAGANAPWARALFLVLGKFPEAQGLIKSWWMHLRHKRAELIEYK